MKRITTLCFIVLAGLWAYVLPAASANLSFTVDGYKYIVRSDEDHAVTLSMTPMRVGHAIIPATVEHEGITYDVVWIGGDALSGRAA